MGLFSLGLCRESVCLSSKRRVFSLFFPFFLAWKESHTWSKEMQAVRGAKKQRQTQKSAIGDLMQNTPLSSNEMVRVFASFTLLR